MIITDIAFLIAVIIIIGGFALYALGHRDGMNEQASKKEQHNQPPTLERRRRE